MISYRIWMPWFGRPTSYASGYISAQWTATESHSLLREFSSPPTYWIGLPTRARSGSRRSNRDSTGTNATSRAASPGFGRQASYGGPGDQNRITHREQQPD